MLVPSNPTMFKTLSWVQNALAGAHGQPAQPAGSCQQAVPCPGGNPEPELLACTDLQAAGDLRNHIYFQSCFNIFFIFSLN